MALSELEIEKVQERLVAEGPKKWYHSIEVVPGSGIYTEGDMPLSDFDNRLRGGGLTRDWLKGKRVLDIGTYTGAFAFYMEECGAEVVATDVQYPEATGFKLLHELRGSKVDFRLGSVYDLNPEDYGYFDLVGFYGVFYHLKHPVLAFERINSVCREGSTLFCGGTSSDVWMHDDDRAGLTGANFSKIMRSDIDDTSKMTVECLNDLPISGFASTQYFSDKTNWFIPNFTCLKGWLKRAGFSVRAGGFARMKPGYTWSKEGIGRSSINCVADYVSRPELEYGDDDYQKRYNPDQANEPLYQFRIPVQSEVDRLEVRVKELEKELAAERTRKQPIQTNHGISGKSEV